MGLAGFLKSFRWKGGIQVLDNVPIGKFMTLAPKVIGYDQSLSQANDYMRKLHVRHLPVSKAGKLIGVISDRDLSLALYFRGERALEMRVAEALTENPFFAPIDMPMGEVAAQMVSDKYGCVLIMDQGRLAGIFTYIDALRALAHLLREKKKPA